MSRFVDIETLRAEGHSVLDIGQLHAKLGIGLAFEDTVKPDAFSNFGFDQSAAALAQTGYVAGRQTHISGLETGAESDDPNSDGARMRQASRVVGQSTIVSMQLDATAKALWGTVDTLTSQINDLERDQAQIVVAQGALQQEQAITAEMQETAEEGMAEGFAAYEAAEAAEAEANAALEEQGITPETYGPFLEPQEELIDEAEAAADASMAAQYQMYGAARMQAEAAIRAQREAEEAARLEEEMARIEGEIAELTEELNLTQAQIGRLEDPEVIAAIERGDLTIEDAISNVSNNLAADGSTLTVEAAADADGQGIVVEPGVSLSASYNNATGLRPEETGPETGPELSQAELVMQRAQEAAARTAFTPT